MPELRVAHVSPTYFSAESFLGGGERFAEELARAMSKLVDVRFVSFGRNAFRERRTESYERIILRNWSGRRMSPFNPALLSALRGADVIHCHQYYVLPTFLAAAYGRLRRARVFVTDLGGGGWTPAYHIDQSRWITGHLPLSQYAARAFPGRSRPHRVISGAVDLERYAMRTSLAHDGSLVFLGRILPHKGIHFLVEALPEATTLHVLGPAPDAAYLERLRSLASGKDVRFHIGLEDAEIVGYLQRGLALVHPTPVDSQGSAGVNELFGLALVEAMACGCPVIASDVASLAEIVVAGETGLLVPPNSPAALRTAIVQLQRDESAWRRLALGARARALSRFGWDRVAASCLEAYETLGGR